MFTVYVYVLDTLADWELGYVTAELNRDIEAINMAGIPIRSISGVGGGFEIMPEYKIDGLLGFLRLFVADAEDIPNAVTIAALKEGDEMLRPRPSVKALSPP
mgnify:CR=1 FL=1